jgi:hypothetical protein
MYSDSRIFRTYPGENYSKCRSDLSNPAFRVPARVYFACRLYLCLYLHHNTVPVLEIKYTVFLATCHAFMSSLIPSLFTLSRWFILVFCYRIILSTCGSENSLVWLCSGPKILEVRIVFCILLEEKLLLFS